MDENRPQLHRGLIIHFGMVGEIQKQSRDANIFIWRDITGINPIVAYVARGGIHHMTMINIKERIWDE